MASPLRKRDVAYTVLAAYTIAGGLNTFPALYYLDATQLASHHFTALQLNFKA